MTQTAPVAAQPAKYTDVVVIRRDGSPCILRYSADPAAPGITCLTEIEIAPARLHEDGQLQA